MIEKKGQLFTSIEAAFSWLQDQSPGIALSITTRAALRYLPNMAAEFEYYARHKFENKEEKREDPRLCTFRALALLWGCARFPKRADALLRSSTHFSTRMAMGYSLARPRHELFIDSILRTTGLTKREKVEAGDVRQFYFTGPNTLREFARDAEAVSRITDSSKFLEQPLWLEGPIPENHLWPLNRLRYALQSAESEERWHVWQDWYEARLRGDAGREDVEVARLLIPEDVWLRGPEAANSAITEAISLRAPKVTATASLNVVPSQGPGPHFRANERGLVDRAPAEDLDADGNDLRRIAQLRPLVLRAAGELEARLSKNEVPELYDATVRYRRSLKPEDTEKVEWGEVWGLGVVLQNAATAIQRKIDSRLIPELEDPAKAALDSMLELHGPLILATRDGISLSEMSRDFLMTREAQAVLRSAAESLAEELRRPHVATIQAANDVMTASHTIGVDPHPERGSVYGLATIKNVSIVLVGGAALASPTVIGAMMGQLIGQTALGVAVGAPVSLLLVEAVKKNPTFSALVTQLGAKLDTMTDIELRSWLNAKAELLAHFRKVVISLRDNLRKLADASPELKWMIRYIDLIVEDRDDKQKRD